MVILANKIYDNEQLVPSMPQAAITAENINNTPVQAWLVKNPYCCGGNEEWQLEFKMPASLINVITGVWIQIGAEGFLIDGNIADVVGKLGGCCGTNATVTPNYPSGLPAYQAPVAKNYTVTHTGDDGTIATQVEVELSYIGNSMTPRGSDNVLPNSFSRTAYNSSTLTGTYVFQAYDDPAPQGSDTIVQTALVFNSNSYATSLSGSNVYRASGLADGISFSVKGSTTFASLVTALQADAIAGPLGTWSTAATHVTLTTTTVDVATIVVDQTAP